MKHPYQKMLFGHSIQSIDEKYFLKHLKYFLIRFVSIELKTITY